MNDTELTIKCMLKDCAKHHRSKEKLLAFYIQERLDKSVKSYYSELIYSCNRLSQFNELSVAKKMLKDKGVRNE